MANSVLDIETIKTTESYVSVSPHPLQTLDVYHLTKSRTALWLIFIHGGAWRDPLVTSAAATPLFSCILNTLPVNAASINYRLSPHPSFPHHPHTAKHPDHINDVLAALRHLRTVHGMQSYALIGHSAGATLAFQALNAIQRTPTMPLPKAVVGVEGIYDLPALVEEYPDYVGFVEGAFGGRKEWPEALGLGGYTGLVVLAQSDEDGLLSWRQTQEMKERCDVTLGVGGGLRVVKVEGEHDAVLTSRKLAGVIERYFRDLI